MILSLTCGTSEAHADEQVQQPMPYRWESFADLRRQRLASGLEYLGPRESR